VPGHRGGQLRAAGTGAVAPTALTVGEEEDLEVPMEEEAELGGAGLVAGEEPLLSGPEEDRP
jgi:hypothetical protein